MNIFKIGNLPKEQLDLCGGKAKGLDFLKKQGFNIPDAFVILDATNIDDESYALILKEFLELNSPLVSVRSSADNEDGSEYSNAGQYETVLNVDENSLRSAIERCIKSLRSDKVQAYAEKLSGKVGSRMNVVVQKMVQSDYSGVTFTTAPEDKNKVLIEAVSGLGENLVSGTNSSYRYLIPRTEFSYNESGIVDKIILEKIYNEGLQIAEKYNFEADLEWAVKDGTLYWLQLRPITTLEEVDINEFNPTHSLDNQLVTTRNIGEMMPGAITPLSISTSVLAIDYGMRYMLKTVGVYKNVNDVPDFSMAFAYKYHLFINMTQLHKMGKRVMIATPHDMNLSVMGEDIDNYPETDMKKACAFTRLINSIKMVKYLFSSGKTRTKLTKLCDDLVFSADDTSVQAIYDEITEKLATLNKSLCYHYVCSSFSGSMNSALTSAVSKDFKDKSTLQTFISSVLSDIDGIESANILESLRNIGTLVKQKNPDAVNYDEDKLLAYLSDENNEEVNSIYKEFLARHGHRSIKEAEMRSKAWKNDPKRLMRNLHTVMLADYTETKNNAFDIKKVLKEYGYSKSPMIKWFVKKARNAVVDREYSKSQIIRVIDKFKDRYSLLAKLLTEAKLISDEDCIYFMSHKEIGELIAGNTSLKKKCITRRAKFKEAEQISFPDIVIGTPKPVEVSMENVESVSGITVCKGKVYGRAHVVHSVADAETLKDGEVMVAAYTDIGWSPYYSLISALITEVGSTLSHGAVVAREYCLPTIVNVKNATQLIHDGDCLMVDADNATISIISEADFEKVAVTA